jgi:transcription elongation factor GreA
MRARSGARRAAFSWFRRPVVKEVILTPEGYDRLKQEIELLSTEKRREVADRIRVAREFGDIAENSEYDDAKNEQAMLEKQIADLEEKLRNARVIDEKSVNTDIVEVGVTVHVKDQKTEKSTKYKIVGSAEASPAENKLSNESPVGNALIGHKRGEIVSVPVPRGPARKLKITKIEAT